MVSDSSAKRAIGITFSFEGSGWGQVTGNFDGQGLSCGGAQWCLGQGSLQPLLRRILNELGSSAERFMAMDHVRRLCSVMDGPVAKAVAFGNRITDPQHPHRVLSPWRAELSAVLSSPVGVAAQKLALKPMLDRAEAYCVQFGLKSEPAFCLMFDIVTQNGSIGPRTAEEIRRQWEAKQLTAEKPKLEVVAVCRANASKELFGPADRDLGGNDDGLVTEAPRFARFSAMLPQMPLPRRLTFDMPADMPVEQQARSLWRADVLSRKLCIARGYGHVHGKERNLAQEFGLSDAPYSVERATEGSHSTARAFHHAEDLWYALPYPDDCGFTYVEPSTETQTPPAADVPPDTQGS